MEPLHFTLISSLIYLFILFSYYFFNNLIYKTQLYKHYNVGLITLLYLQNITHVTYNTVYLCWQYNTRYSFLQKIQILAVRATYTANNTLLELLAVHIVTYNTLYCILALRRDEFFSLQHLIKTNFQDYLMRSLLIKS